MSLTKLECLKLKSVERTSLHFPTYQTGEEQPTPVLCVWKWTTPRRTYSGNPRHSIPAQHCTWDTDPLVRVGRIWLTAWTACAELALWPQAAETSLSACKNLTSQKSPRQLFKQDEVISGFVCWPANVPNLCYNFSTEQEIRVRNKRVKYETRKRVCGQNTSSRVFGCFFASPVSIMLTSLKNSAWYVLRMNYDFVLCKSSRNSCQTSQEKRCNSWFVWRQCWQKTCLLQKIA